MKELLTLNRKEQNRLMVLNQIEKKQLSVVQASLVLKITERQVWRLLAAYRREGAAGLAHGNRNRKPTNSFPGELKEKIVELATCKYWGFNHTHFTEKLAECEKTYVSRSSVRRILLEKGVRSPRKRKSSRHRSRRERYPQEGMLLQTDGSPHDWLEGRGPKLCLIGAIDDATNKVPYALFQEQETTEGYMRMLQEIVLNQGIPLALYHDRHTIFRLDEKVMSSLEEQLNGKEPKTQLGRLLDELSIESIAAHSPQAKGRVERLWGTFQDRLASELRLAGASTIEQANQVLANYLPCYNQRFAVIPRESLTAYRKPDTNFKPEEHFCFKNKRTVGCDNVVRFNNQRLQILSASDRLSFARCKIEVQTRLNGSLAIYYQGKPLDIAIASPEATLLRKSRSISAGIGIQTENKTTNRIYKKPAINHPWRTSFKAHFD